MTQNEVSSIVFTQALEEILFLCSQKPAGWTGPQGSLCPGLWSLFTLGFPEAPAEKEGGEFLLCFLFKPRSSSWVFSTLFILVGYNFVLDMWA